MFSDFKKEVYEFTKDKWKSILEKSYPGDRPYLERMIVKNDSWENTLVRILVPEKDIRLIESALLKIDNPNFSSRSPLK